MVQVKINTNKRYLFPCEISIVNYAGKILVIAPEYANWIVLDSANQQEVFEYLRQGHTIEETLNNTFNECDVNHVVCQLEARQFCSKVIHNSVDEERNMHLYLTNKCNLSCPHCYMYSGKSVQAELTTNEIMELIHNYKSIANGTKITISGGEPTIRPDFEEIIKYATGIGLSIKLLTNGSLFSKARVDKLSKYISSVQISIDGFSEESNAPIRGEGHFQKALETIECFIVNGVETSIAITPPYTLIKSHVDDYVAFAKCLINKYSSHNFCVKFAEGLSDGRSIKPTRKENEEYSKIVKLIQKQIYGYEYDFINFVQVMQNDIITDNCMFGVFAVTSNGDVYLCPEIGKLHPIANIKKDLFKDIYEKALDAERATSVNKLRPCKDCELRYICGGGCRIEEFTGVAEISSFKNIQIDAIQPRECGKEQKEKFYELMINSNEYLFKGQ